MRIVLCVSALAVLSTGWLIQTAQETKVCELRIHLIDAESGLPIAGLVNITDSQGQRIKVPELLPRGLGLPADQAIHDWSVITEPTLVSVPQSKLKIKAFSGLETEFAEREVDLRGKTTAVVNLPIKRFYDAHKNGYRNANTHVHLQKVTRKESDQYLVESATADGLDLVFVSYLERAEADVHYLNFRNFC